MTLANQFLKILREHDKSFRERCEVLDAMHIARTLFNFRPEIRKN